MKKFSGIRIGLALLILSLFLLSAIVSGCFHLLNLPNSTAVFIGLVCLVVTLLIVYPAFAIWLAKYMFKPAPTEPQEN